MRKLPLVLAGLLCSCVNVNAQVIGPGPIASYPFTGNSNDASGNGHHGVVANAVLTSDRFGHANSAYYFSATMQSNIVANIPNLPVGSNHRSINAWVKWSGATYVNAAHIANWGPSTNGNAFGIMVYKPAQIWYGYGYNEPQGYDLPTNVVADTQWHMLTYTYGDENGMLRFWIDGHLRASRSTTLNTLKTDFYIGARPDMSYDCFFTGKIDDIGVYDYALDSIAINTLFKDQTPLSVVSVSENDIHSIYPIPSNDFVYCEGLKLGAVIHLIDVTGRIVLNTTLLADRRIDISALATPGIYQLQVIQNGVYITEKIIKQ